MSASTGASQTGSQLEGNTRVQTVDGSQFDGQPSTVHPPDLYVHSANAAKLDGLDAVTDEQIALYREQGYLAVENAFSPTRVQAAIDALSDLIMGRNPEFKGIQFESWSRDRLPGMTLEQREDAVRKLMWFERFEPRLAALAFDEHLQAVIRRLMNHSQPKLFQDMALLKPPGGREKPWHQDHAYFNLPAGTPIVGVWIALDEATPDNGCMRLRPGSHRTGPVMHFQRRDWQICDSHYRELPCVVVPFRPGGVLLFDGLLQHGTPHNPSGARRRAVQFHFAPADVPATGTQERLALFGSEGGNVTC